MGLVPPHPHRAPAAAGTIPPPGGEGAERARAKRGGWGDADGSESRPHPPPCARSPVPTRGRDGGYRGLFNHRATSRKKSAAASKGRAGLPKKGGGRETRPALRRRPLPAAGKRPPPVSGVREAVAVAPLERHALKVF